MKRFFESEIGAAVVWVCTTLLLAALLAPWLYQAGRHLGEVATAGHGWPTALESLGRSCRRADFGRYFNRALLVAALGLTPCLLRRIRTLRRGVAPDQALWQSLPWREAGRQWLLAMLIAGTMFCVLGGIVIALGAFVPRAGSLDAADWAGKVLLPAIGASGVEEWVFRGLLLGLWLRYARPLTACLGSSLLFAFLHFLKPPVGTVLGMPVNAGTGFELLGKILLHFVEPQFFVTDFVVLLAVGLLLAWARWRSGALWFSMGMHAGWILAFKTFNLLFRSVGDHPLRPWAVGDNLRSGVLPLVVLGVTAWLCHMLRQWLMPVPAADPLESTGEVTPALM